MQHWFDRLVSERKGSAREQAERLGPSFYSDKASPDRPQGPQHEREQVGKARGMDMFPRKYSECLEHNQKIKICCRHMENVEGRTYKTNPNLPGPDLFIATCKECGCNHYRLAVGEQ